MKYVFLFVGVYGLLFAHKHYTRVETASPIGLSAAMSRAAPSTQIREILAEERDGKGPLSQAFETLSAKNNSRPEPIPETFDTGAFQFLAEGDETLDTFSSKLATYSRTEAAQDYGTQKDLLSYALSLPANEQSSLVQVSLSVLESISSEDPPAQKGELVGLAVGLLKKQISDPFRLDSLTNEIRAIHKDDPDFLELFNSALSTTDR